MEKVLPKQPFYFLEHGGEMGSLTRQYDWSTSSIGTPDAWPQALRISLSTVFNSGFPMFLFWGEELTCFYNDAFRPSLGAEGKHPAVGKAGKEVWPEIWDFIGPLIYSVLANGEPVLFQNQLVPFYRNGRIEDIYWTFSYSLIQNDDGRPGGVLVTCIETTGSVLARRHVEESEAQLKALILQTPVPTMVLRGADFLIDQINDSMLEMMGRGKEVAGRPLLHVMPELEGQYAWQQVQKVFHEGISFEQSEVLVPHKRNGAMQGYYYNVVYRPLKENGAITGMIQSATDVTEQVLAKRKLEESEAKLRSILNSAPTAIGVFAGPDLIVENANQLMIEVMAAGPGIEGKSFRQLLTGLVEEDQKFLQIIDGVRTTGQPFEAQEVEVYFKAQKKTRYFNINFIPLTDESDTIYAVLDVSVDVTEQVAARKKVEESETFNRTVLENSPDCVKIIDAEGRLQFMNTNGLCIMEIDDFGAFKHLLWKDLWGEENRQLVNDSIATALTGETAQFKAFCPTAKGTPKWWDVMVSPVKLPGSEEIASIVSVSRDITEQINAQRKIEESEARFRSLIEEAPVATCVFTGPEMVIELANVAMLAYWGKGNSPLGKPLAEALPELAGQPFLKILEEIFVTGETFETKGAPAQLEVNGVMGTYYFDYTFKPLRNAAGEVYAIMDMAIDVTGQVLSRQKIEESQRSLLNLFEESPVGIATIGVTDEFVFEFANAFYGSLVDRHPEELIGKPLLEALPELKDQGFEGLLKQVVATGLPFEAKELPAQVLRGGKMETIYIDFSYHPRRDAKGAITGILAVVIDVSQQVQSRRQVEQNEKQLETALEQARLSKEAAELGTFDMDMVTGAMHWDSRCRLLFGISHQQTVSYQEDFIQRLHPDDQHRILAALEKSFVKAVSDGEYDVEYRTIGAEDGLERWVKAKGKVYFNEEEMPVRFIGSVLDITAPMTAMQKIERTVEERTKELAAANTALQTANKELQRSNSNLEEFAHAASHDLKEPIRKITFFTHQLKDQLQAHLQETELRSFNRIENATQRMGHLIDDLLLYSHVSQRPHEMEKIDLNVKVQRVLEDLELDVEHKKAVINVGKLPVIQGYRRQLQQLFQNLISNALKYSKTDIPPHIEISAGEAEENGKRYNVLSVKDDGIGFNQDYAEKIFQMFTRLHGRNEYSGTGVGLSIVKKVVENHNGFIRVESAVDKGSVFEIYLPA